MPPPESKEPSPWRLVGFVLSIVFIVPAGVLVGGLIGWWLDSKLGSSPVLFIVCLAFGFVAGLLELFREFKRMKL